MQTHDKLYKSQYLFLEGDSLNVARTNRRASFHLYPYGPKNMQQLADRQVAHNKDREHSTTKGL